MAQAAALIQDRAFRNETAIWFSRYSSRKMFAKMGYTSDFSELRDDEAEWFKTIAVTLETTREKITKQKGVNRGKKNV